MPASARLAAPIVLGVALALSGGECVAQSVPQPPCGGRPSPAYAEPGNLPAVRTWTGDELGADWTPAACTGWRPLPLRMLVAAAGRFRHQGTVENLLERFGAVSALTTIRYWSVSDQRWQNLITSASALAGPDAASRRSDFSVAEMRSGTDLYFAQHDNRSTGDVVYRLRVREVTPDRLVSLPRPRGHPVKVHHAAPAICSWAWAGVKKPRPECRRRRLYNSTAEHPRYHGLRRRSGRVRMASVGRADRARP